MRPPSWACSHQLPRRKKEIIERLHNAVAKVIAQKIVIDRFAALGASTFSSAPAEFTEYIKRDYAKMQRVVKEANIRQEQ